jgi:hypothetical protein
VSIPSDRKLAETVACREAGCWAKPGKRCNTHGQAHKVRIQLGRDVAAIRSEAEKRGDSYVAEVLLELAETLAGGTR